MTLITSYYCRACNNGQIRLVNGTTASEGTLQLCLAGRWNGVCVNVNSQQEAITACRQLNCNNGERVTRSHHHNVIYSDSYQYNILNLNSFNYIYHYHIVYRTSDTAWLLSYQQIQVGLLGTRIQPHRL